MDLAGWQKHKVWWYKSLPFAAVVDFIAVSYRINWGLLREVTDFRLLGFELEITVLSQVQKTARAWQPNRAHGASGLVTKPVLWEAVAVVLAPV